MRGVLDRPRVEVGQRERDTAPAQAQYERTTHARPGPGDHHRSSGAEASETGVGGAWMPDRGGHRTGLPSFESPHTRDCQCAAAEPTTPDLIGWTQCCHRQRQRLVPIVTSHPQQPNTTGGRCRPIETICRTAFSTRSKPPETSLSELVAHTVVISQDIGDTFASRHR